VEIAFSHGGLTHYGGILFFNEFTRVLQFRRFLSRHLLYPRRNQRYTLSQMIMALVYPVILGLDRLETASFLRSNGYVSVFDRPAELSRPAKLTAISVAGCAGIQGTVTPAQ